MRLSTNNFKKYTFKLNKIIKKLENSKHAEFNKLAILFISDLFLWEVASKNKYKKQDFKELINALIDLDYNKIDILKGKILALEKWIAKSSPGRLWQKHAMKMFSMEGLNEFMYQIEATCKFNIKEATAELEASNKQFKKAQTLQENIVHCKQNLQNIEILIEQSKDCTSEGAINSSQNQIIDLTTKLKGLIKQFDDILND
jgi:exonuclease VII small subunit